MTKAIIVAGARHAAFLAGCTIGGIRVALAPEGGDHAAGTGTGAGETEFKAAAARLKEVGDEVKRIAESAQREVASARTMSQETKNAFDTAFSDLNKQVKEFDARLADTEQKAVRRGGAAPIETKSLGQIVVENDGVKSQLLGGSQRGKVNVSIETKAIMSSGTYWGATGSVSNALVVADRLPPLQLPTRQMTIRDLIAPGQTTSNAIEFPVQTTRTNNAAPVPEGALKPTSDYRWDMKNFPVRTIAHLVKASRQILDDAPALQSLIDAEMRYGLEFAEEAQFLYGDGTGANLLGIVPQASAYNAAFTLTAPTAIDVIRLAMLQSVLALLPVTGTVLHPTDWAKIETLKDGMGRYLVGDPQGQIAPRLWGLPVVPSMAMNVGTFLTGSFRNAAQIFDRMNIEVLISTENNDDFEKNMVTIRAEERLALVVKRPQAFITGALPA
ncbi:phage major capsid protein [Methylobacterium indicum]|uniref:phage major capsid protein n=1 Tax=Methylobacterium indicum TaxID=1775910 RepID=UPI0009E3EEE8|nr:phage major capsid protein [Methylobacterium indicum]